jgi:hypothetical protein
MIVTTGIVPAFTVPAAVTDMPPGNRRRLRGFARVAGVVVVDS